MVFQAGIQTKIREGGLSGKIQLRSYEGLMGVGEGLWALEKKKILKMGTGRLAPMALVWPSKIFTYPQ